MKAIGSKKQPNVRPRKSSRLWAIAALSRTMSVRMAASFKALFQSITTQYDDNHCCDDDPDSMDSFMLFWLTLFSIIFMLLLTKKKW